VYVYLSEACRQLQIYSSCKCRKSRPSTKCSPTCPCAECTLSSLPPLSGGFASQGPASAAGAFLWCRCSNAALRSSSWFLREVVFELLLFLRASSAPLCVVVACTLVLTQSLQAQPLRLQVAGAIFALPMPGAPSLRVVPHPAAPAPSKPTVPPCQGPAPMGPLLICVQNSFKSILNMTQQKVSHRLGSSGKPHA
jgi:hypothetical protein